MKPKFLLFTMLLVFTGYAYGQSLLYEDFSAGTMPPSGWTIDAHATNWSCPNTGHARGTAPEARFFYSPTFTGYSRLISPGIVTTGYTSLTLSFLHMVDDYANLEGYSIGVATRANGGPWNVVWELEVTGNISAEYKVLELSTSDVGSSNFQFCIFFNGYSYNLDYWYIDNISLGVTVNRDVAMFKLDVPRYNLGSVPVKGSFVNMGLEAVTSADIKWQINSGDIHTTSLNGINVAFSMPYNFTCTEQFSLTPGIYLLKVWQDNINNLGADINPSNDSLILELHVASQAVGRRPFFEEFTSSTCSPCADFNTDIFNPFISQYGDELTLVKYQMSWPTPGDPYYTAEGGIRRYFYGVGFVPDLYADGTQTETTISGVNGAFSASLDALSFMDISATHFIDGMNVTVQAEINSYASGNLTAFIAVVEKITTGNASSNSETEFHHVMMKMVPNPYGTPVTLVDGQTTSIDFTVDMTDTFVEEMSDLMVAVWVQDTVWKDLFQSVYSDETTGIPDNSNNEAMRIYPNPSSGKIFIDGLKGIEKVTVLNSMGELVCEYRTAGINRIDLSQLANGLYILKVRTVSGEKIGRVNILK